MKLAIHSHALGLWCPSILCGERLYEEACVGKPQAGFCEGEAHNGAWSNTVTLSRPKGESNREHKADLHTGGVLSTRPGKRICFSKTTTMHDLVIGLFINRYEFGVVL